MLPYSAWLKLSIDTRHKIAQIFKIPKKGATEVVNNEIVRDGFNIHDIEAALTKEALQAFLGSTLDNYMFLWEDTVNKIEGNETIMRETFTAATEEEPITTTEDALTVGAIPSEPLPPIEEAPKPKKRGRKPKA